MGITAFLFPLPFDPYLFGSSSLALFLHTKHANMNMGMNGKTGYRRENNCIRRYGVVHKRRDYVGNGRRYMGRVGRPFSSGMEHECTMQLMDGLD